MPDSATPSADTAQALFHAGYNCCQAVFCTFCEAAGIPRETGLRLTAAMGAGIGGQRATCGAVSALALLAGLKDGTALPPEPAEKRALYATVKAMAARFSEETGSTICRDLLASAAITRTAADAPEARTPAYYARRPCTRFIRLAAQIAEETLFQP